MKHIEQFNKDINNSSINRFAKWENYRNQIDEITKNYLVLTKNIHDRVLLVGAGNCDDLNIGSFTKLFNQIFIADIDVENVQLGLKKQRIFEKVTGILKVEFTGFENNNFFNDLIYLMSSIQTKESIKSFIDHKMKDISESSFLKEYIGYFDLIVISPIYTQLIYNQVLSLTNQLRESDISENLLKFIETSMLDIMPLIIDAFNKNILFLLKKHATLIVLSDIFQSEINSSFYQNVLTSIQNLTKMDQMHSDYVHNFGYGLGDYGLLSLKKMIDLKKHHWLVWPFDDDKHMIVQLAIFNNDPEK
ncbi:MAG: hypothetical protein KJ971_08115 [Firmicutes bacterium]|nr:hypothetical protein [Bacillota bacterium]